MCSVSGWSFSWAGPKPGKTLKNTVQNIILLLNLRIYEKIKPKGPPRQQYPGFSGTEQISIPYKQNNHNTYTLYDVNPQLTLVCPYDSS